MELTKKDTQMAKGVAVLGMVVLHLFCRTESLPYMPLIWCGTTPLVYYLGLFGDLCVPVFCFCSGYAHYLMADNQKKSYPKRIPGKILRFLWNYWIVVILFSILGLLFDKSGQIPGNWVDFIGNMLVIGINYNGAWWFVTTYLFLLILSPALAALIRRANGIVLLMASFLIYFVAYLFRFNYSVELSSLVLRWFWDQMVLLGTSQLAYCVGMVFRKYGLVAMAREYLQPRASLRRLTVFLLPTVSFAGHCIIQSAFVAPFTALAVLIGLFVAQLPELIQRVFLMLGKHSTNIWLVHMFFYITLFPGLVFCAKTPVLVLLLMLVLCFASSLVINALYYPVLSLIERKKQTVEENKCSR